MEGLRKRLSNELTIGSVMYEWQKYMAHHAYAVRENSNHYIRVVSRRVFDSKTAEEGRARLFDLIALVGEDLLT